MIFAVKNTTGPGFTPAGGSPYREARGWPVCSASAFLLDN